jgi:hypothetical protein
MLIPITEYDLVFISYDEPNADENYQDLLEKCPWAKRSHGVWGSDAAHKAAAALSETDNFVTVDADNIIDSDFFNVEIDDKKIDINVDVVSWSAKNTVNGLVYGNGGIKFWPKRVVEQMKSHEIATNKSSQVDFCWDIHYAQMNNIYSYVYNNSSCLQAWRAGFREGVKMSLDGGDIINHETFKKRIHYKNYKRLLIWMSVGVDSLNGLWAMYGARLGCEMVNFQRDKWDWVNVRDFNWLTEFFKTEVMPKFADENGDQNCFKTNYKYNNKKLLEEIDKLGDKLRKDLRLEIAELGYNASKFFKECYINPARTSPLIRENQVILS